MTKEYGIEPTGANIPDLRIADALKAGWYLLKDGRLDQAFVAFNAVSRHGYFHDVDSTYLMGAISHARGRFSEANLFYGLAITWYPGYSGGHIERMLELVRAGERGPDIPKHDWPWDCEYSDSHLYRKPFWSGCAPLDGRTILLHEESIGLGDAIQLVRYATAVKDRGAGRIILECHRGIVDFLGTCPGIDHVVAIGDPLPDFDIHTRMLGLMGVFGLRDNVPYLSADPARVDRWRLRLADIRGLRVGICWQGYRDNIRDQCRSVPLSSFESLSRIPGIGLVSLQKGYGVEQLDGCQFPVVDFGDEVDPGLATFDDTPAIITNLDLVITVDTSVAHAAGALGVPVWILLSTSREWRWDMGGEDTTPWYPTARLFRQRESRDWPGVFAEVAEELDRLTRD